MVTTVRPLTTQVPFDKTLPGGTLRVTFAASLGAYLKSEVYA